MATNGTRGVDSAGIVRAQAARRVGRRCQFCRKVIHRQRNGAWYHDHNSSASCRPGEGSDRRATP